MNVGEMWEGKSGGMGQTVAHRKVLSCNLTN